MRFLQVLLFLALQTCLPAPSFAADFSSSAGGSVAHFSPGEIIRFAKKVERTLAEKGAYVAIVGRMGRPPSDLPEGMHFTHVGFAVYSRITTSEGKVVPGYQMYNLYQEDTHPDRSDLVKDFPVDFFSGVAVLQAGVIIPSPELQKRLIETIESPAYEKLHDPRYSAIASPYTLGRQNCTEFVLDVINSAIYRTEDERTIKAAERKYFVAQKVNVDPLKLLLGSMFSSEISLSDQEGEPVTATFETIGNYLKQYDQGSQAFVVEP